MITGFQQQFSSSEDVHTVCSLLKLYLRELPEPLVPFDCYNVFQSAVKSKSLLNLLGTTKHGLSLCSALHWNGCCSRASAKSSLTATKTEHECTQIPCVSLCLCLSYTSQMIMYDNISGASLVRYKIIQNKTR